MDIITELALSIIVAIISAYFTVKFSLKKFYSQRIWEIKEAAYSDIIEQISVIKYYFSELWDEFIIGSKHTSKELFTDYKKSFKTLHKVASKGAFIISNEAADALKKFMSQLWVIETNWREENMSSDNPGSIPPPVEEYHDLVQKFSENFTKIAKKDISNKK